MVNKLTRRRLLAGSSLLALTRVAEAAWPGTGSSYPGRVVPPPPLTQFPIGLSADGRSFVTADGKPWLMVADSAQGLMGGILPATSPAPNITTYVTSRAANGFNAVQFDVVATGYAGINTNANYGTPDGLTPFTPAGPLPLNFTSANATAAYWARVDAYVALMQTNGLVAILNPYETGSGITDLDNVGVTTCTNYGIFLGNRYKNSLNVMWHLGNDFTVNEQGKFNNVQAIMQGIRQAGDTHLMTVELMSPPPSTSFDNYGFGTYSNDSLCNINGIYSYCPQYYEATIAWNAPGVTFLGNPGTNTTPPKPVIHLEGVYDEANVGYSDTGTPLHLRNQSYWNVLGGGIGGQIYGNAFVWPTGSNPWQNHLVTTATANMQVWSNFLKSHNFPTLKPDQGHVIATAASSGTPQANVSNVYVNNTYIPTAADSLTAGQVTRSISYFSKAGLGPLTINMNMFLGPQVTAQWFDPTNASSVTISGSPFANTGTQSFTMPGNNAAGDPDWVLVLTGGVADAYATVDGFPNAPTANANTYQNATLLNTYRLNSAPPLRSYGTSATFNGPTPYRYPNANYPQPPWFVAGVDYPVGPRTALADAWPGYPTVSEAALDAGFVTQCGGYANITLTPNAAGKFSQHIAINGGPGITVSGWDFSLHSLSVANSGADGMVWSDCKFKWTTTANLVAPLLGPLADTVQYCLFDGNAPTIVAPSTQGGVGLIQTWQAANNKTTTIQYCALINAPAEAINYNPANMTGTANTFQVKYCAFVNAGGMLYADGSLVHGDLCVEQTNGLVNNFNIDWCLIYQSATWNQAPWNPRTQGHNTQGSSVNATARNNTCISLPTAYVNWFFLYSSGVATQPSGNIIVTNNYGDTRGCGGSGPNNDPTFPVAATSGTHVTGGNFSLVTGLALAP